MNLPVFPTCSSSAATSCFSKVMQKARTTTSDSWIVESSLDVQTAHQMCQNCTILLVEAASSSLADLLWGVDKAVALGAQVVSMSWGRTETSTSYDSHFSKPGIAFVASSGDSGYGSHYPASSQYVTAVGGTTLRVYADNTWASETAWASGGSGCSPYEPKPSFQPETGCANRAYADVAADADYDVSGAAIYDSFGINGTCGTVLCTAGRGYDGPTGVGTPNGLDALR